LVANRCKTLLIKEIFLAAIVIGCVGHRRCVVRKGLYHYSVLKCTVLLVHPIPCYIGHVIRHLAQNCFADDKLTFISLRITTITHIIRLLGPL